MNSSPTGTDAMIPKMMNRMLGGISAPMVPAAATTPVARPGSYLFFSISGTAMRPIAAAQATDEPVIAAKPEHPMMLATARPPGIHDSHTRAALNRPRVMPV